MGSKAPTLMLTTPYANLTYAWLYKPEPKYGYYQLTLVFKPDDTFIPADIGLQGTEPQNSVEFMVNKLEGYKKEWKEQLNRENPDKKFTWSRTKEGAPKEYWKMTEQGLEVYCRMPSGKRTNKQGAEFELPPPKFAQQVGDKVVFLTRDESAKFDKISPESRGQAYLRVQGFELDEVGLRIQPVSVIVRNFVAWDGMSSPEDMGFKPVTQNVTSNSFEDPSAPVPASASDW
tara:strand:+ start:800 stop:1492 length:693 start_codon:yes stop_codon:yes gene_type:complete